MKKTSTENNISNTKPSFDRRPRILYFFLGHPYTTYPAATCALSEMQEPEAKAYRVDQIGGDIGISTQSGRKADLFSLSVGARG